VRKSPSLRSPSQNAPVVSLVPASTIAVGMPGSVYQPRAGRARNIETALVVARDEAAPSVRQLVRLTTGAADGRRARAA